MRRRFDFTNTDDLTGDANPKVLQELLGHRSYGDTNRGFACARTFKHVTQVFMVILQATV
ncbi:hypothetical protein D3C73_1555110 [compost metagenome]